MRNAGKRRSRGILPRVRHQVIDRTKANEMLRCSEYTNAAYATRTYKPRGKNTIPVI